MDLQGIKVQKKNLFTCGHVNMSLCGKIKDKEKRRPKVWAFVCLFFLTGTKKVLTSQRTQQNLDL